LSIDASLPIIAHGGDAASTFGPAVTSFGWASKASRCPHGGSGDNILDTPEYYSMPGHLIRRMHQIAVSIFADRISEAGFDLTSVQFSAMNVVDNFPGIDQATLAGMIAYDRVTIGGVVDRLSRKGYLERRTSDRDRRARELYITAEGKQVLETILPIVRDIQDSILSGLDAGERETISRLLRKAADGANTKSRAPLKPMEAAFPRESGT